MLNRHFRAPRLSHGMIVLLVICFSLSAFTHAAEASKKKRPAPVTITATAAETIGVWDAIQPTAVILHGKKNDKRNHLGTVTAAVKAQVTTDTIAIQIRWPDATKSTTHKTWEWDDEDEEYIAGRDREDRLALMFPMTGDFDACMLAGGEYTADVWHWKAARTAPAGYAHDKNHIYGSKSVSEKSVLFENKKKQKIFITRLSDAGGKLYHKTKPPTKKTTEKILAYTNPTIKPENNSIADVKAIATHDGKFWTLTLTRKLNTGHPDDTTFERGKSYPVAIAGFDRSGDAHHSTGEFTLVLPEAKK